MSFSVDFRARSLWLVGVAVAFCLAAGLGCGGGDSFEPTDFTFDDLPEEEDVGPLPTIDPFGRLTGHDDRELRLQYLHDIGAMLYEMEASRRSMVKLVEDALSEPVDLDWVIDAHTAHRESEEFRVRAYGYPLPEDLVDDYISFHASFLETVQMFSFGADRLLGSAIVMGPTGRLSSDMLADEATRYRSLASESFYYMSDAEILMTRAEEDLKELLKDLRVR